MEIMAPNPSGLSETMTRLLSKPTAVPIRIAGKSLSRRGASFGKVELLILAV
jgi:hypothetical protein